MSLHFMIMYCSIQKVQSLVHAGSHAHTANLFCFLVVSDVTSSWLTAVTHVSHVCNINVFSFLFPDHKPNLDVTFWSLAFRASSEEHR